MSKGFKEFEERVISDKNFGEKVRALKSVEATVEFGKGEGYVFTAEDVRNSAELTETELAAVAGGGEAGVTPPAGLSVHGNINQNSII
jgi:predicted ribosomally synthesized peptide with nif11-like leader